MGEVQCHSELVLDGGRPASKKGVRPCILIIGEEAEEADRAKGSDAEDWEENGMSFAGITNGGAELLGGSRVGGERSSGRGRRAWASDRSRERRTSRAYFCVNDASGCSLRGMLEDTELLAQEPQRGQTERHYVWRIV